MKAKDFEFDNKRLSDFGLILCRFDSGGLDTVGGVQITFNTVSTMNGQKHYLASTQYEQHLETTLQVCKYSCASDIQEITATDYREISKWLLRKNFLKFKILDEDSIDLYHNAAFSGISKIEIDGRIVGLELNLITNAPFSFKEPKVITIKNTEIDGKHSINDTSYEEGFIYPYMEITVNSDGNLKIYNAIEDRWTNILNCKKDEVIIMDYPVIQSSDSSHDIQNNFNWKFFRIANTYENSRNDLIISLPCTIKLKYSPIVKVGL